MRIRKLLLVGWTVLLLIGFSSSSQAGSYGTTGALGVVDLVNNTVQVGKIVIAVSSSSVIRDSAGFRIGLADLEDMDGEVSASLYRVGGSYMLKELQFVDEDEEG